MKFPKSTMRYCPHCKARNKHKISQVRTKQRPKSRKRALKWGIRQFFRIRSGFGGMPRSKGKKSKQSQRITLKYTCEACKKSHIKSFNRMKKFSQM